MKRLLALLMMGGVALACGGTTVDPVDGGGDTGTDSTGPFACGTSTCTGDEVCIHPCCGGAIPLCVDANDAGVCPAGTHASGGANDCAKQGTGVNGTCAPNACTPPPPYCAPKSSCPGSQQDPQNCYEACA